MRITRVLFAAVVVAGLCAAPALAQEAIELAHAGNWSRGFGAGIGAGITILGAGFGISLIGSRSVESMARQPEVAGNIQTAMIISAALIEGVTFFALVICYGLL